jgi:hypothetical protein
MSVRTPHQSTGSPRSSASSTKFGQPLEYVLDGYALPALGMVACVVPKVPEVVREPALVVSHCMMLGPTSLDVRSRHERAACGTSGRTLPRTGTGRSCMAPSRHDAAGPEGFELCRNCQSLYGRSWQKPDLRHDRARDSPRPANRIEDVETHVRLGEHRLFATRHLTFQRHPSEAVRPHEFDDVVGTEVDQVAVGRC